MTIYRTDSQAIIEAHDRLKKTYRMEKTDRVPVIEYSKEDLGYSIKQLALDKECMLSQQLKNISLTSYYDTDYVPFLEPWICVPIYIEPFGAKIKFFENEWPAAEPIITNNPNDVYKLKSKKVWESDLWKRLRGVIEHFQQNTKGDLPIAITDPQGPFTSASLLWQTDQFFMACYQNPKEVHYLLNLLTEQFIEFTDAQLKIIDNPAYPGHSFPLGECGRGISISDDNSVMINPELFEEFCLPYLNRISEHYNGLYYHSCGNYMKTLPSIMKIKKLRAVNYHTGPYEMISSQAREIIDGKCAVWSSYSLNETGWRGEMKDLKTMYKDYYIPQNLKYSKKGIFTAGFGSYYGTENKSSKEQQLDIKWIRNVITEY